MCMKLGEQPVRSSLSPLSGKSLLLTRGVRVSQRRERAVAAVGQHNRGAAAAPHEFPGIALEVDGRAALAAGDYLLLVEANVGVGLMPESAVRSNHLVGVPVSGLSLSRTVTLYAVSGRQHF
jgi:hypothetical protein